MTPRQHRRPSFSLFATSTSAQSRDVLRKEYVPARHAGAPPNVSDHARRLEPIVHDGHAPSGTFDVLPMARFIDAGRKGKLPAHSFTRLITSSKYGTASASQASGVSMGGARITPPRATPARLCIACTRVSASCFHRALLTFGIRIRRSQHQRRSCPAICRGQKLCLRGPLYRQSSGARPCPAQRRASSTPSPYPRCA